MLNFRGVQTSGQKRNLRKWHPVAKRKVEAGFHNHLNQQKKSRRYSTLLNTVDGRNPKQPPGMYKTL